MSGDSSRGSDTESAIPVTVTCDGCGDDMDVEVANGFLAVDDYHECEGKHVHGVGIVDSSGITVKDGYSLRVVDR